MTLPQKPNISLRPLRGISALVLAAALSACASTPRAADPAQVSLKNTSNVGQAALKSGNPEIAMHVAKAILAYAPDDPVALTIASTAAWQMNKIPEARRYAERAVAAGADDVDAHLALGRALDRSDPRQAMVEFGKAYKQAPGRLTVAINYGVACVQNGYPAQGISILSTALQAHPDSAVARYDLALALTVSGRPEDAMKSVRMLGALAREPDAPPLYAAAYDYAAKVAGTPADGK